MMEGMDAPLGVGKSRLNEVLILVSKMRTQWLKSCFVSSYIDKINKYFQYYDKK